MLRNVIPLIVFITTLSGCSRNADPPAGASPVFFIVKDISDKYQSSPVPPYSTSYEIEVIVVVGCRSKQSVRFDQLLAVFHANGKPMSAVTHVMAKEQSIMAYYTQMGQTEAPIVPPEGVFDLKYGEGVTFVLATANSNFGLLAQGTDRKVVVTLRQEGRTAYGPFDIALPWSK